MYPVYSYIIPFHPLTFNVGFVGIWCLHIAFGLSSLSIGRLKYCGVCWIKCSTQNNPCKICTWFCCALVCCGCNIVLSGFMWLVMFSEENLTPKQIQIQNMFIAVCDKYTCIHKLASMITLNITLPLAYISKHNTHHQNIQFNGKVSATYHAYHIHYDRTLWVHCW